MSTEPDDYNLRDLAAMGESSAGDTQAREAQFLVDLAQLAADRAAAEAQLEAQRRARSAAAERSLGESRQSLAEQLAIDRRDMMSDYEEARSHALARYERDLAAADRAMEELQVQVAADYDRSIKRAERKVKEARWEAEALFEASKDVAPKQLKEFEENLQTWRARLDIERSAAQALMAQWRQPPADPPAIEVAAGGALADLTSRLRERIEFVADARLRMTQLRLPQAAAQFTPVWVAALAVVVALIPLALGLGWIATLASLVATGALGVAAMLYVRKLAAAQVARSYPPLLHAAAEAERVADLALDAARNRAAAEQAQVIAQRASALAEAEEKYQSRMDRAARKRDERLVGPAQAYPQRVAEFEERRDRDLRLAEEHRNWRQSEIERREADAPLIEERYTLRTEQINRNYDAARQTLVEQWQAGLARLEARAARIRGGNVEGETPVWIADWSALAAQRPAAAVEIPPAVRFGELRVTFDDVPSGRPADPRLAALSPSGFTLPAVMSFPAESSLVVKCPSAARREGLDAMAALMLRLLVSIPPGKLRFTVIDPVGLGENFAAFMHLADHNEALITSRIWTDPKHIEQRLADLQEHMENVIQKYLRNEFPTIEAYNRAAGEIAEPYRYLVIADFPAQFSEAAQRRLLSIVTSGPRCGVYTLILADTRMPLATGMALAEIERASTVVEWHDNRFVWRREPFAPLALSLDVPPDAATVTEFMHAAGRAANQASRVEVPFEVIAPAANEQWKGSTDRGIEVPLGRAGATRLQYLKLGQGTSQHVLVAGKTGSGKSTLLHALVTNLALRFSPDQIELYLVDFKQGVEFKTYATHRLPHARVVAVESDREFGLSVLEKLDVELKVRADRFRAAGVADLAGLREADPKSPSPRILLVVDEFQEFFVEDDKIAQDAALLLDRLVRQGRAFGIHVLLGSQTLAGTYSLARSTIGQMAVRIALQCSETDAHLILSEDNSAARLLARAGEAIYNDSNGLVEGNHPFQVVWLGDERREHYLAEVRRLAERDGYADRSQVVFEGNVPAELAANGLLAELLSGAAPESSQAPRAWLGEAVAIKDPTSVVFRRQSGSNLLVVGQNEQAAVGIFAGTIVSIAAQYARAGDERAQIVILDGTPVGSEEGAALALVAGATNGAARVVSPRELGGVVLEIAQEVERRSTSDTARHAPLLIMAYGVHKLRDLRRSDDDFSFSRGGEDRPPPVNKQFTTILRDGPSLGVYTVAWCDSVNNVTRTWDRQTLREFEWRVALQMSGNDSSTFIDSPAAGRLGAHRALVYSDEQGTLEKFRPYRLPSIEWLSAVRQQLQAGAPNGAGHVKL